MPNVKGNEVELTVCLWFWGIYLWNDYRGISREGEYVVGYGLRKSFPLGAAGKPYVKGAEDLIVIKSATTQRPRIAMPSAAPLSHCSTNKHASNI